MQNSAIEVCGVNKTFVVAGTGYAGIKGALGAIFAGRKRQRKTVIALSDVNIKIRRGETVALIGRNGSGKSTLLSMLANVILPDTGSVSFPACVDPMHPRLAPLLEVGAGFHPDLTGNQNVYFNGAILGMSREIMQLRYQAIVEFADFENPEYLDAPVRTYSSGMFVRLGFAVAVHTDPEIILIDETLAVGDSVFQEKCYDRIRQFQAEGRTIVFVSHDDEAVKRVATRAIWLRHGKVAADGPVLETLDAYHRDTVSPV